MAAVILKTEHVNALPSPMKDDSHGIRNLGKHSEKGLRQSRELV